jgi:hypothetical protein
MINFNITCLSLFSPIGAPTVCIYAAARAVGYVWRETEISPFSFSAIWMSRQLETVVPSNSIQPPSTVSASIHLHLHLYVPTTTTITITITMATIPATQPRLPTLSRAERASRALARRSFRRSTITTRSTIEEEDRSTEESSSYYDSSATVGRSRSTCAPPSTTAAKAKATTATRTEYHHANTPVGLEKKAYNNYTDTYRPYTKSSDDDRPTSASVERPSFTSIETPELFFRVDSMESVQSDSSALVALRERVKKLDGMLDDLKDKVAGGDCVDFDEDGMVEELYSLEYSEQKLRQELDQVDVLLAPTLSAEQRDANVSTLLESLEQRSHEVIQDDDDDDEERAPPPPDWCGDSCDMSSSLNYYSYTIGTHNAWSRNFMEEEEEEVELVFENSPTKKKQEEKSSAATPTSFRIPSLEIPYPLEFSGRLLAEDENPIPMTPYSCFSTETHESNILRVADHHHGGSSSTTTPRAATDRELKILSIPSLDQVDNNYNDTDHDGGFFCCMGTPHMAAFGCDEEHDLLLSPAEESTIASITSGQQTPLSAAEASPASSSPPFSPMCDLNKEQLSTISEGLSADLMSPRNRQWNQPRSQGWELNPFKEGGDTDDGSSIFEDLHPSKDESMDNDVISPSTDQSSKTRNMFHFEGLHLSKDESMDNDVISPSTDQSSKTRKMFNFEKKKRENGNSRKSATKDARALQTPISTTQEADFNVVSSTCSSTSEMEHEYPQPQHHDQQCPGTNREIENSLRYELQFGASADLLSSTDGSTHHQMERMPPTLLHNLKNWLDAAKSSISPAGAQIGTKEAISSNLPLPKSPLTHSANPGSPTSPSSPSRRRKAFRGRPPVSPKNKSDKQHVQMKKHSPRQMQNTAASSSPPPPPPQDDVVEDFPLDERQTPQRQATTDSSSQQPLRKLCLEAESIYNSDFGEIQTPHHESDVVSPLPSFRSITDRRGYDDDEEEYSIITGTAMSKPIIVIQEDEKHSVDYHSIEEAPTDELLQKRSPSKLLGQSVSVKVVNSYDDPKLFKKEACRDDYDAEDAIVDTLARLYLRVQIGKFEVVNDYPMMDLDSIKESIHSGTFDEDYGGYDDDDDSIQDTVSRLAKRIQVNKYSTVDSSKKCQSKTEMEEAKRLNDDGNFFACFDNAIECVIGDDICHVPCDEPLPAKLENDDYSLPSIVISPTNQSSILVDAEKSYLKETVYPKQGDDDDDDGDVSDKSPDLKLTASIDACVTCLSPQAPQLPLREELPSLGVELIFREKPESCSASVGDLSELKERKRRIENDLHLERSLSYQEPEQRTTIHAQTPRRQHYGRVFRPSLEDSPTPRIRNIDNMTSPRIKNGDFTDPRINNTAPPIRQNLSDTPDKKKKRGTKMMGGVDGDDSASIDSSFEVDEHDRVRRQIEKLLRCNEQLLQSIVKFDFSTYQSLVTDDLTGVEPGSKGRVQRRQAFHRDYMNNHSSVVNVSMLTPCVRFLSDEAAIVTYIRLDLMMERDGTSKTKRTSETRVWEKGAGKKKTWRNCHFHSSTTAS